MSKQDEITYLQEELKELLADLTNTPNSELEEQKLILSKSYNLEKHIANQSKVLIDLDSGGYYSVHSIYEKSLPDPAMCAGQEIHAASWIALTHPNDVAFILKLAKISLEFLNKMPLKLINRFSVSYSHRIMNTNNEYDCYIVNYRVVLSDETGKPRLLLQRTKLCPKLQLKNENLYRLVHVEPASLFKKSKLLNKDEYTMLSDMEKEVMLEINKGKIVAQIADSLNLSNTTVTKHCRNINNKAGMKFIKPACIHAAQLGLFQLFMLFCSDCMEDLLLIF